MAFAFSWVDSHFETAIADLSNDLTADRTCAGWRTRFGRQYRSTNIRCLSTVFGDRIVESADFAPASSSDTFVQRNYVFSFLVRTSQVPEQLALDLIAFVDDCRNHCLSWALETRQLVAACREYLEEKCSVSQGSRKNTHWQGDVLYELRGDEASSSDVPTSPGRLEDVGIESGYEDSPIYSESDTEEVTKKEEAVEVSKKKEAVEVKAENLVSVPVPESKPTPVVEVVEQTPEPLNSVPAIVTVKKVSRGGVDYELVKRILAKKCGRTKIEVKEVVSSPVFDGPSTSGFVPSTTRNDSEESSSSNINVVKTYAQKHRPPPKPENVNVKQETSTAQMPPPVIVEPVVKKRGRPKGSKNKPKILSDSEEDSKPPDLLRKVRVKEKDGKRSPKAASVEKVQILKVPCAESDSGLDSGAVSDSSAPKMARLVDQYPVSVSTSGVVRAVVVSSDFTYGQAIRQSLANLLITLLQTIDNFH